MATTLDQRVGFVDRRIELCVRSLASRTGKGIQEQAIDRLQRLETTGELDALSVRIWGEEVALSTTATETERGRAILQRVGAFREWAAHNDVSLAPFFEPREKTSRITGEEYATLRLPVLVMAEYVDGDIVHVAPHRRDSGVYTVEDRLASHAEPTSGHNSLG
jgi:hypothetical protein